MYNTIRTQVSVFYLMTDLHTHTHTHTHIHTQVIIFYVMTDPHGSLHNTHQSACLLAGVPVCVCV